LAGLDVIARIKSKVDEAKLKLVALQSGLKQCKFALSSRARRIKLPSADSLPVITLEQFADIMDTQRIIAFIVFSFSILLLWESWQTYNNPKPRLKQAEKPQGENKPFHRVPICRFPVRRLKPAAELAEAVDDAGCAGQHHHRCD
jgi:hypothetical protein